jgi:signal transduction histidine kinase
MAGGIAHDFNTALTIILGNTQLLLRNAHDDDLTKTLKVIEKAAQDSARTVRQLIEFTRKGIHPELLRADINAVIEDSVEMAKSKWKDSLHEKGAPIEIVLDLGEVPYVVGTGSEWREIIIHLIHNAIEAMSNGGRLKIRSFQRGERVYIQISDTGIGMIEEVKNRIFEPFFTTKPFCNTGLGLSMCYGMIKRFGGEIEVDSKWGEGTTFTITLPSLRN